MSKLTKPQKEYFMGRMQGLAALFEKYAAHQSTSPTFNSLTGEMMADMSPDEMEACQARARAEDPEMARLMDTYMAEAHRLGGELDDTGHGDEWNDLMAKSGAVMRMEEALRNSS